MKNQIKNFLKTITGKSTRSLVNTLVVIAILPFLFSSGLAIILNLQFPLIITELLVVFGVIMFIFGGLIMIIRKEIPVYSPFRPIKGKWAVLLGGFQVVILIIFLMLLDKSLLETIQ